ncbi:MAG: EscU/YscU/HrcU family type III secretion system export apparatus switch protein [Planctomycetota bacterium]
MAEDLGERTEAPTPRKLAQAKEKGQVPRSTDLTAVIGLIAATVTVTLIAGRSGELGADLLRRSLGAGFAGSPVGEDQMIPMVEHAAIQAGKLLAPVIAASALVAVFANAVQSMPVLSLNPLQPKLSKLSPLAGVKRILGPRGAVKTGMSLLKLTVVVAVVVTMMGGKIEKLAAMTALSHGGATLVIARLVLETVIVLLAVLLLIALLDFLYQKWQHSEDLKMSKQEVKDERKSLDGDPEIKRRRSKMMAEAAQQRVGSSVPEADVVVTNPTHFSVCIKYEPGWRAPKVTAKGGDYLAFRIRALAVSSGVPIVERPPLARALYWNTEPGQEISPEQYEAVAEVLAYVYRLDAEAGREREPVGSAEETPAGVGGDS